MKRRRFKILFTIIGLSCIYFPSSVYADSISNPRNLKYFSKNKIYCFDVTPEIRGNWWHAYSEDDTTSRCRGTLYFIDWQNKILKEVWSRTLLNKVSPMTALVSDSGKYVVTLDDWGEVGNGKNVVVIYGQDGALIKNFALTDLLSKDSLARVGRSVASTLWAGDNYDLQYLDETVEYEHLVLNVILEASGDKPREGKWLLIVLGTGKFYQP